MSLSRIAVAWLLVSGWLLLWEAMGRPAGRGGTGPWLRPPLWGYAAEALLVTLLGTLWIGSLGAGQWWLVFALVGALAAWPRPAEGRRRRRPSQEASALAARVIRMVVAGGLVVLGVGLG